MKTIRMYFLAALFLCLSQLGMATGSVEFVARVSGTTSFALTLKNAEHEKVEVILKDELGIAVFEETYTESGIQQTLSLERLPLGTYSLIVKSREQIQIQPIERRKNSVVIDERALETVVLPFIDQSAGYVVFTMICPDSFQPRLEIVDDYGNVLYRNRAETNGQVRKRFDLTRLAPGQYHFTVAFNGPLGTVRWMEQIQLMPGT